MCCWGLCVAVYKKANNPNLQRTQIERVIKIPSIYKNPQDPNCLIKKFPVYKNVKNPFAIYTFEWYNKLMRFELDEYERDALMETIQYRIENDEHLLINASVKDDLEDLLDKFLEDEYV